MTDKPQPPDGYELWSPKKGDVYPQGYLYGGDYGGDYGYRWVTGSYPGRDVQDNLRGYFCKPVPINKTDPIPQGQPTMDKAFITKRPQWSALLGLSLIAHEIGNQINALADQDDSGMILVHAEALDELVDLLRDTADDILFTDHKEPTDVK